MNLLPAEGRIGAQVVSFQGTRRITRVPFYFILFFKWVTSVIVLQLLDEVSDHSGYFL